MTHTRLENICWYAVSKCLGLDPNSETEYVQQRVRISWPQSDTGSTNWERDANVAFIRVTDGDPGMDDISQYRDVSYQYDEEGDTQKEIIDFHKAHLLHLVCYGPDAYTDAMTVKLGITRDDMRAFFQRNKLGVMPHIREPKQMNELDDAGDWWERWDLFVYFYERLTYEFAIDFIDQPPSIITMGE